MNVVAGPKGLQPGDELTVRQPHNLLLPPLSPPGPPDPNQPQFFYPSTEWYMAQPFDCLCGTPTCRGRIAGARDMTLAQLDGLWLNGHIRELLEERENPNNNKTAKKQAANGTPAAVANGHGSNGYPAIPSTADQTVLALRDALTHAEKVVEAARLALVSYVEALQLTGGCGSGSKQANGSPSSHGQDNGRVSDAAGPASAQASAGAQRRGPTSRELSGEMGGDTSVHV